MKVFEFLNELKIDVSRVAHPTKDLPKDRVYLTKNAPKDRKQLAGSIALRVFGGAWMAGGSVAIGVGTAASMTFSPLFILSGVVLSVAGTGAIVFGHEIAQIGRNIRTRCDQQRRLIVLANVYPTLSDKHDAVWLAGQKRHNDARAEMAKIQAEGPPSLIKGTWVLQPVCRISKYTYRKLSFAR